ncbi:MAG: alginate export family protein [Candidatus Omnitrophota bacterium]
MSKRWMLILALMFLVGLTSYAYAETQNIKVSGDILLRGIARNNFTLVEEETLAGTPYSRAKHKVKGLTSTARVRVDADLTDDVSATIRLLNERSWGRENYMHDTDLLGRQGDAAAGNAEVTIDLAYITLKEFLYSPLTVIAGRQELRYGNALLIGDSDTNLYADEFGVPMDLSSRKSFDAVRGILDYDPLTIDLIYAKIDEHELWWYDPTLNAFWIGGMNVDSENIDQDLYGVYAHYDLAERNAFVEGYYLLKQDKVTVHDPYGWGYPDGNAANDGGPGKDIVNTVGILIGGEIIENLTGSVEYARQFGKKSYLLHPFLPLTQRGDLSAFAVQANLDYVFGDMETTPSIGVGYTYLSGDDMLWTGKQRTWEPMFEDQTPNSIVNALFYNTNCEAWHLRGAMKPREDMTVSAVLGWYRLNEGMNTSAVDGPGIFSPYGAYKIAYASGGSKDLGMAVDLDFTYDYTEDVQLGLHWGYFDPGDAFDYEPASYDIEEATELIGSMKVTF